MKKSKLTVRERQLFALISKAAYVNPFSKDRENTDFAIIGSVKKNISSLERVGLVIKQVDKTVKGLLEKKRADINLFSGDDFILVRDVLLFYIYHTHMNDFDELILNQQKDPDNSLRVPFAKEALALFKKFGFTNEDADKYFAIFYQMRRAFYFIAKSMIGVSDKMRQLRLSLWNNIFTYDIDNYRQHLVGRMEDFSTLFLGETGSGKGTAAVAIGRSGFIPFSRQTYAFKKSFCETFISLNLSQYTETLIESELFGHRKGSFTGAVDDYKGVFARCSRYGSIFLDEIGEISIPVQIKLLQVLQERTFSPVGSHQKIRFSGRVIGATNQNVDMLREQGIFRDDFFYRLCSDVLVMPSLRERIADNPEELKLLLSHTIEKMIGTPSAELLNLCLQIISKELGDGYKWPGNVRELEQCVRRIILNRSYCGDKSVPAKSIADSILEGDLDAETLLKKYANMLYDKHSTIAEVARIMNLDRRTVKKYIAS